MESAARTGISSRRVWRTSRWDHDDDDHDKDDGDDDHDGDDGDDDDTADNRVLGNH